MDTCTLNYNPPSLINYIYSKKNKHHPYTSGNILLSVSEAKEFDSCMRSTHVLVCDLWHLLHIILTYVFDTEWWGEWSGIDW